MQTGAVRLEVRKHLLGLHTYYSSFHSSFKNFITEFFAGERQFANPVEKTREELLNILRKNTESS